MDETTQEVVEDNNLSNPTEETTLTEQPTEAEVEQPEQVDDSSQAIEEPSVSPNQVEGEREVKRQPRVERRFDQFTKKLADVSRQAQPQAHQFLPTEMPRIEAGMEYGADELDNILTQKAQAISSANTAQLVAAMQTQSTVNTYVNQITEDTAALRTLSPLLDPSKLEYDPDLESAIAEDFEGRNPIEIGGRYNPNVNLNLRLKDVAKKHLDNVERYRTKGQVESRADLAAAADSAVLSPGGTVGDTGRPDSVDALRDKLAGYTF